MHSYILGLSMAFLGITLAEVDLTQLCLNKNVDEVIAHPYDCRAYIICGREISAYYCDPKFHFDSKKKICNWPEYANCQPQLDPEANNKPFTTYAPFMAIDVQSGNIIDPLIGYDAHNVMCRHFGAYFLPHPFTCRSYILCAYGHMHEHNCGQGTLWNYKLKQCVLNINAECYKLTLQEAEEIKESQTDPLIEQNTVCYPIASDTTTVRITTQTTQAFPPTPKTPSSTTSKTHASSTTSLMPTKGPHISHTITIVCPHKKQSYVAHPKDCSKYFMCIMGNPVMTSCPQGLLWDAKKEFCDLAKNVKCFV